MSSAGRAFREMDGIAALELIDARASALTAEHAGVSAPVDGAWQLLIELAGDTDQTERLADALEGARLADEPAVGVDAAAQQRLWQVREAVAEVLGVYGPPLKFDVSLPLSVIPAFASRSRRTGRRSSHRMRSRCCSATSAREICISIWCGARWTPTASTSCTRR